MNDAAITRDGKVAVTVGGDCVGRVWDVAKGVVTCVLEGHSDNIRSVVGSGAWCGGLQARCGAGRPVGV